jgi:DNA topoisomerase-1
LFAEPKKSGRRQMTKRVIRQIEVADGGKALQVLEGRYGPYVTDGETNASVPNGTDPATLSLEDARALIEARRGAPPRANRRGRAAAGTSRPRRPGRSSEPAGVTAAARAPAKRKPTKRKTAH